MRWNTFHVNIKCLVSFFVLVIKKKLHFTHGQPIAFSWRLLIGSNAAPRKKRPDNNKNNFHFPSVLQVFFSHQTKIISEICTCMLFTEIRHILKLYFVIVYQWYSLIPQFPCDMETKMNLKKWNLFLPHNSIQAKPNIGNELLCGSSLTDWNESSIWSEFHLYSF